MAQINLDSATVRAIKNDDIIALLQRMIEDELSKSDEAVDTVFVDECVNALLELEQDMDKGFAVLVPLVSASDYLNRITGRRYWNTLSRSARVAVISAVFATSTLVVNAAVENFTGINLLKEAGSYIQQTFEDLTTKDEKKSDEELPSGNVVSPVTEEPTTVKSKNADGEETTARNANNPKTINTVTPTSVTDSVTNNEEVTTEKQDNSNGSQEETTKKETDDGKNKGDDKSGEKESDETETDKKAVFDHIEAAFNGFKYDYIYGEALSYNGLTVYAVYSDGSRKQIPLSECTYTQSVNMNKTADYTLRVIYKNSIIKIDITVRPDEETRASSIESSGDWDYLLTQRGAYLTKYRGSDKEISVNTLNGSNVYAICGSLFENGDLTSFSAPQAKKIFADAFKNAKQLQICNTPQAEYVGDSAFEGCESLTSPSFGSNAGYIGKKAYAESGITSISIPNGMNIVPEKLCYECEKLETANLNGASVVGDSAFSDCTSLETVTGTDNLKTVGETAFYGDEKATLEDAPSNLESVDTSGFAYCKSISFGELTKLKTVGEFAFMYCSGVTAVTIDDNIKTIPQGAFWGTRIREITLPEGLKRIESAAFMSTMIRTITIPESVEYIGARAFQTASGLTVTFNGSPEIENAAFFKSNRLKFYAYEGSSAIAYAIENDINYEIMERS